MAENEVELVTKLAEPGCRDAAFAALVNLGPAARDAVREGLGDGRWEVRRWCLYWLLQFADPEDAAFVAPLLHDPRAKVRHVAMFLLSRALGEESVPLLIERALGDESLQVRRQAVAFLAWRHPHPHLAGFFAELAERESDATLRKYARAGVARSC